MFSNDNLYSNRTDTVDTRIEVINGRTGTKVLHNNDLYSLNRIINAHIVSCGYLSIKRHLVPCKVGTFLRMQACIMNEGSG